jgi:hypothetical protein
MRRFGCYRQCNIMTDCAQGCLNPAAAHDFPYNNPMKYLGIRRAPKSRPLFGHLRFCLFDSFEFGCIEEILQHLIQVPPHCCARRDRIAIFQRLDNRQMFVDDGLITLGTRLFEYPDTLG